MEQRPRVMKKKKKGPDVYRRYIEKMKKITKERKQMKTFKSYLEEVK